MKRFRTLLMAMFVSAPGVVWAGTISYVAIPSIQSDSNCGISREHGYTTAVDGGNSRGTDRVINEITLFALKGAGQNSATADNCTLNALSGTLTDAGLTGKNIAADGTLHDVISDMVFNNAGGDNSQIEIVLDPESLEQGSTYDLRVYICSSSGQNRQVNLAFFGDGQNGIETGFFNEDDARTSAGGFQTQGQVYYIDYRYTWDGDSTPGITITQKAGGAPFCLYALTNELVSEGTAAAASGGAGATAAAEGGEAAAEGDEGLSAGLVDQESDEIGVESDDFYGSESLNSNGRWVKLSKWGTCWQPTNVQSGWCPYTNGSWKECDDCGWTFVSDEPWAWACYHYGRWAKVSTGCGWAWVPGKVWAPAWVSWRQGREKESSCDCIGWAPLPPEAGCELNVGISSWVDSTCNIGPEYYTFVNLRDFGSDSYFGCGCIYDRFRNTTIIIDTFNCTNICWNRHVNIYCGGPDYNWCNTRIRQLGGRECGKIYVNRYDNPGRNGGKWASHNGEQLGLVSPRIHNNRNAHQPKIAESVGADKIDHGWKGVKDKKQEQQLRNHIANESKGKNPRNSPARLPEGVAEKMKKHQGGRNMAGAGQGQGGQTGQGAGGLKPGGKRQGQGENLQGGGGQAQGGGAGGAGDQHPGKGGRRRGQGQVAGGAGGAGAGGGGGAGQGSGFNQHPGKKGGGGQGAQSQVQGGQGGKGRGGGAGAGNLAGGNQQGGGGGGGTGGRHPGQSFKKQKGTEGTAAGGAGAQGGGAAGGGGAGQGQGQTAGGGGTGSGGKGKRGRGQGTGQGMGQQAGGGTEGGQQANATGGQGQGGGGGGGKGRHKQGGLGGAQAQGSAGQQLQQGGGQAATGGSGGGGKGGRRRSQHSSQQGGAAGGQGQVQGQGGGGGGQGQHHQQGQVHQQQLQQQQQSQQHHQQQQQHHQQQQQQQEGGGGGGQGKKKHGQGTPPPG